jgi:hypothetical protein
MAGVRRRIGRFTAHMPKLLFEQEADTATLPQGHLIETAVVHGHHARYIDVVARWDSGGQESCVQLFKGDTIPQDPPEQK